MKAKIIPSTTYDIEINGVTHTGFDKGSTWNNMTEYKSKTYTVIVDSPGNNWLTDWLMPGEPQEFTIIKMSPLLLEKTPK